MILFVRGVGREIERFEVRESIDKLDRRSDAIAFGDAECMYAIGHALEQRLDSHERISLEDVERASEGQDRVEVVAAARRVDLAKLVGPRRQCAIDEGDAVRVGRHVATVESSS